AKTPTAQHLSSPQASGEPSSAASSSASSTNSPTTGLPGGPYKFSGPHKSTIQRTACRPIVRLPVGPTSGEAGARGLALAQRGPEAREARRAFEWRGAPGRASPLSKPWTFRIGAWNPDGDRLLQLG